MTLLPGAPPGGLFQTFKLQIAIACEDGGGEKRLEQRAMLHGQPEAEPVPIVDVTVHVPVKNCGTQPDWGHGSAPGNLGDNCGVTRILIALARFVNLTNGTNREISVSFKRQRLPRG